MLGNKVPAGSVPADCHHAVPPESPQAGQAMKERMPRFKSFSLRGCVQSCLPIKCSGCVWCLHRSDIKGGGAWDHKGQVADMQVCKSDEPSRGSCWERPGENINATEPRYVPGMGNSLAQVPRKSQPQTGIRSCREERL